MNELRYPSCIYRVIGEVVGTIMGGVRVKHVLAPVCKNKTLLKRLGLKEPIEISSVLVCIDCDLRRPRKEDMPF